MILSKSCRDCCWERESSKIRNGRTDSGCHLSLVSDEAPRRLVVEGCLCTSDCGSCPAVLPEQRSYGTQVLSLYYYGTSNKEEQEKHWFGSKCSLIANLRFQISCSNR